MFGQSKQPTLGEKEKELRAVDKAEGLRKPAAPVGAAATAPRKRAVPAKSKEMSGSGTAGRSTSLVAGPPSAAMKTQHRLALQSMAPMLSSPERGFCGICGGLSLDLGQVTVMVGDVAEEQECAVVLEQVPLASPTIRGPLALSAGQWPVWARVLRRSAQRVQPTLQPEKGVGAVKRDR